MQTKCKHCKKNEAIWAWQPELQTAYRMGYHERGFTVIKLCDDCLLEAQGRDKVLVKIERKINGIRREIGVIKRKMEAGDNWLDIGGRGLFLYEVIDICEQALARHENELAWHKFMEAEH